MIACTVTAKGEYPMEFLVEFEVNIPVGTPESEVEAREGAEASAASKLVEEGHLLRLWKPQVAPGETKAIGLYRAETAAQLDGLIEALPFYEWMRVTVTRLEPHPNDPGAGTDRRPSQQEGATGGQLPSPRLTLV